ncbi:Ig-like domain-containing protein [Pseudoalteromonas sp. MMG005]|uniref:Ig-like domain-containing protein n=1 Tax=Pseudoalteromonas sp. MMG005 TaxID=2822682 RepID=UPI001B3A317C|nr:Ig-like domain-containing protein [Pseudoalteromonas sp. MMG005]MBQ4844697.1 M4 family metallopeptidase [Pseudoalteromonas sp. MMG005]
MFKLTPIALLVAASSFPLYATQATQIHTNVELKQKLMDVFSPQQSQFSAQGNNETSLQFKAHQRSADGKHIRRSQHYRGVRVYGGEVVTHHDAENYVGALNHRQGTIKSVSGSVVENVYVDVTAPSFDESQAIEYGRQNVANIQFTNDEHAELVIYPYQESFRLAYIVTFYAETLEYPTRPELVIDAQTGEVLSQKEMLAHAKIGMGPGGNEKTGKYYFGESKAKFNATDLGNGHCAMKDRDIRVIDMEHGTTNTHTFEFPCFENTHKTINGAYSPLNDAVFYGQATLDMFHEWFDSRALSSDLVMRIHYRQDYLNAFWNGKEVTFGDGDHRVYPFTSLGVIAHEVAHGVTHQNSKLVYSAQSGGVNESFSDMTSEALECYLSEQADGSCVVDWKIGARIFKNLDAMRYLDMPSKDGRSIDHASEYKNGLDVHYSSGVFNRAFYLLSTTENWGVKKAYEVMLHANKNYWVYNGNYESLACGVTAAAKDFGYDIQAVGDAFSKVGVFACTDNKAPTIDITSPVNNSRHIVGTNIELKALAEDEYGEVSKVVFSVNGQVYKTLTSAPYTTQFQSNTKGEYVVTATVTDNEGLTVNAPTVLFNLINPSDCDTAQWRAGQVYTQGNKVAFEGFEYTAKWWNRDQSPATNANAWGVWKKGLECGSDSEQPNQAPSVRFISPNTTNSTVTMGDNVTVNLAANDIDGQVEHVKISVNGVLMTNLNTVPYRFNWQPDAVGTYRISAEAMDDKQTKSDIAAVTVVVKEADSTPTAPSVTLLSPSNGSVFEQGSIVPLQVSATDKDGDLKQVIYYVNGVEVVSHEGPYWANITLDSNGQYQVYAIATDALGLASQSQTHQFSVVAKPTDCELDSWRAATVYTAGKKVSHEGFIYEAKWWTRNQNPANYSSQWSVWKKLNSCK